MDANYFGSIRIVIDSVLLVLIMIVGIYVHYLVRRFILISWITKAVKVASSIFIHGDNILMDSDIVREWVFRFLKDNGLTTGFSDGVVETLIDIKIGEINNKRVYFERMKRYYTSIQSTEDNLN